MMNFSMLIDMVSFSNALMESYGVSFQGYSLTLQIIRKSKPYSVHWLTISTYSCRMLLATLRDKGLYLCPRCLVPRAELDKLGLVSDLQGRLSRSRTFLLNKIVEARRMLYNLGICATSIKIQRILKPFSLVPTMVCVYASMRL
jgi:hypothetical protein